MVKPDGKATMLGHWRIALRQAEEAARAGRYDEAIALASRPEVAEHHHAAALRGRMALDPDLPRDPPRRGRRPGRRDRRLPARRVDRRRPDALASARLKVADRVASEVRIDLEAGEPGRVVERVDELARQKIGGPALRRIREVADAWRVAMEEARRGEFGRSHEALVRAERLAAGSPPGAAGGVAAATWRRVRPSPGPGSRRSMRRSRRGSGPRSWPRPTSSSNRSPSTRRLARRGRRRGGRSARSARPPRPPGRTARPGSCRPAWGSTPRPRRGPSRRRPRPCRSPGV